MNSIWADYCRKSIRDYLTQNPENTEFKRKDLIDTYRDEWIQWRRNNDYDCNENALQSHVNDVLRTLVYSDKLNKLGGGWYSVIGEITAI